jgi:transposase
MLQQDLQAVHRVRDRLVCQRTSLINQVRGLLAEYGIVLAKGPWRLGAEAPAVVADALLSELARELFANPFDPLRDLEERIRALDTRLVAICRENAASRRLASLPGVGPVVATALLAVGVALLWPGDDQSVDDLAAHRQKPGPGQRRVKALKQNLDRGRPAILARVSASPKPQIGFASGTVSASLRPRKRLNDSRSRSTACPGAGRGI